VVETISGGLGWHAIFRRNIVFCGWKPMEYLFSVFGKDVGKMAGIMGGMIFSGIFHEYRKTKNHSAHLKTT
jgi:hypothetical protein